MASFTDLSQLLYSEATNFSAYPRKSKATSRQHKKKINQETEYSEGVSGWLFVFVREKSKIQKNDNFLKFV